MARPTSRVIPLLAILTLIGVFGLAFFAIPGAAQEGGDAGDGNETADTDGAGGDETADANATAGDGAAVGALADIDYAFTVHEATCEGGCAFDITQLSVPPGSTVYIVYDSTGATAPHNARPTEGAVDPEAVLPAEGDVEAGVPIMPESGLSSWLFTMPEEEDGEVTYVCDVHPEMTGVVIAGEFGGGAAGGGGHGIVEEGVSFLAHWVGVIAFAVLFIMYGLTFFLFKYNETPFTTDHKDRAVPAGAGADMYGQDVRVTKGTAVVLAILLAVLSIALVWAAVNGYITFGA